MDKNAFQTEVAVSKIMYKEGEKYAQTKSLVFQRNEEEGKLFCFMSRGDCKDVLTESDVKKIFDAEYDCFDDYCDSWSQIYRLTFETDPTQWMNSHCTCPSFAQSFMCKHIVCVAYKLNILQRPKNDQIAPNSKRGRPKNASKGLLRD